MADNQSLFPIEGLLNFKRDTYEDTVSNKYPLGGLFTDMWAEGKLPFAPSPRGLPSTGLLYMMALDEGGNIKDKPPGEMSKDEVIFDLNSSRNEIVKRSQKVLDDWGQDEEGIDELLGGGGACDGISCVIQEIFAEKGYEVVEGGQEGDDHSFAVIHNKKDAFIVDIPPEVYETGGGYNWKKKEEVKLRPEDIFIERLDVPIEHFDDNL